ncbi:hypothetical protein GA0070558_15710 [Micromonospora haikouensis]|uniref:Uncharacterized protein n=1 Tax=Micromonospora haikouensis TaxID=686309 RepID=A0A1C4YMS7_9ACTN|nr:hypothetical protein GA0070558_15710 [Micromonospora haikouensis]
MFSWLAEVTAQTTVSSSPEAAVGPAVGGGAVAVRRVVVTGGGEPVQIVGLEPVQQVMSAGNSR